MTGDKDSLVDNFFSTITPSQPFLKKNIPCPPIYSSDEFWAAKPGMLSKAEMVPPNISLNQKSKEINCFFIHPTGFFLKEWNFEISRDTSAFQRTELMLATQVSAFNNMCEIYAPLYRQATFSAISTNQKESSFNALQLAYEDIRDAFQYFLLEFNFEKPFIIAAHSQGSLHAQKLISEPRFKQILKSNMIAAYMIGYPLEEDYINESGFTKSRSPRDLHTIIQYQTIGKNGRRPRLKFWLPHKNGFELREPKKLASINPISWTDDQSWHQTKCDTFIIPKIKGDNVFLDYHATNRTDGEITELWFPADQEISAKLNSAGLLETKGKSIDRILRKDMTNTKDLHIWDYQIFWNNLRINLEERTNSFLGK